MHAMTNTYILLSRTFVYVLVIACMYVLVIMYILNYLIRIAWQGVYGCENTCKRIIERSI
jgi:hypothetical protein